MSRRVESRFGWCRNLAIVKLGDRLAKDLILSSKRVRLGSEITFGSEQLIRLSVGWRKG